MSQLTHNLRDGSALVVDGNPVSRSILVSQLRDLGLRQVSQASRIADARRQLEFRTFDVVICEQYFEREDTTGQELLDEFTRVTGFHDQGEDDNGKAAPVEASSLAARDP